jgi:sensor histidine kinase regulating citrate/malate metabolism
MTTLTTLLTTHPMTFGVLLGSLVGLLQCWRFTLRLKRGDLTIPDGAHTLISRKGVSWFLKALFT